MSKDLVFKYLVKKYSNILFNIALAWFDFAERMFINSPETFSQNESIFIVVVSSQHLDDGYQHLVVFWLDFNQIYV